MPDSRRERRNRTRNPTARSCGSPLMPVLQAAYPEWQARTTTLRQLLRSDRLHPRIEYIAQAPFRSDDLRFLRVQLYLAAEAQDQHVDAAVEDLRPIDSREIEKLVARQHPLGLLHEGGEQCVFR